MNGLVRTIIIVVLILMLIGSLPSLGFVQWGYGPAGGLGTILLILIILILLGKL